MCIFLPVDHHKDAVILQTSYADPLADIRARDGLRLQLLTTVEQMAYFRYPLPGMDDAEEKLPNIPPVRPSRSRYASPSARSPIFVVDCEMCQTTILKAELSRVTLVSEWVDVFLCVLVSRVDVLAP